MLVVYKLFTNRRAFCGCCISILVCTLELRPAESHSRYQDYYVGDPDLTTGTLLESPTSWMILGLSRLFLRKREV